MYLILYYSIFYFAQLIKYLLNRILNIEFEFKRIFYSNKYLITILNSTNSSSHYIQSFSCTIHFHITHNLHITLLSSLYNTRSLILGLQLHSSLIVHIRAICKINTKRSKIEKEIFCS